MDTLLRETVNAVVNSRFPEMSIEGRRQIESILIREEYPKVYRKPAETSPYPIDHRDTGACCHLSVPL